VTGDFFFEDLGQPGGPEIPADFSCGDEPHAEVLNRYARPGGGLDSDLRRRACAAFAAVEAESGAVAGFCTLSCCEVAREAVPSNIRRKLPRYGVAGGVLLGRMAVDRRFQGRRLGRVLVAEAIERALRMSRVVGAAVLVVDAKTPGLIPFYEANGFARCRAPDGKGGLDPRRMVMLLPSL
jgi:GNAT superfamily N-acetyltransferase